MKNMFRVNAVAKISNCDEFISEFIHGICINSDKYKFPITAYFDTLKTTRITNEVWLVEGTISKGHMTYRNLEIDITEDIVKSSICRGFVIGDACDGCEPYPDEMKAECFSCDIIITTIIEDKITLNTDFDYEIHESHIFDEDED